MEDKKKYLTYIEFHLKKINILYAQLIKEMMTKLSDLESFDLSKSIRFIIDQHVHLEQIAAHIVAIEYNCEKISIKYLNKYMLKDYFSEGELRNIDVLAEDISEKIKIMYGLKDKAKSYLSRNKIKASWRTYIVKENEKMLKSYFRRPFIHKIIDRVQL